MASERQTRRLQSRHAREDEDAWNNGLKHALATPQGRRMIWLLLAECGIFRNPFSNNALSTCFAAGEQNVGQRLLAKITTTHPELYLTMQKENLDAERERNADAAKLDDTASGSTDYAEH